ncbi:MAG: hypothetical protein ACTHZK_10385 [Arthrobacter sp.]|uniref:hypothetical protein n=1 Tax=Arthrobacter sp. 179 TaxID=3457734 RepID=UPI003FB70E90
MAQQQSRSPGRGKPSPEVFRRRRIVVGVALLVVLALLAWAVIAVVGFFTRTTDGAGPPPAAASSSSAPSPSASAEATPSASGSAAATESGSAEASASSTASSAEAAGGTCASGDITLGAATDQGSYDPAEKPVLEMKIENTGSEDCTVNVGTSQQEFSIVSGSDRIFSTTDCRKDPSDSDMTLKAGATESARFTWDRQRSAPGCKDIESKPRPGTYTFTAKLGDVESDKVNFSLK